MKKPASWPKMEYGEGSWSWDAARKQAVLKFMLNGTRTSVRGESTTECMAKRDARLGAAATNKELLSRLANGQGTVTQLVEDWLRFHARGRKPATQALYERTRLLVAESPLAGMPACEVTIGGIERLFLWAVDERGYGQGSIEKLRTHLGMAFEHGKRHGFNTENPARGAKQPGHTPAPKKIEWLDADGFRAMWAYLFDNRSVSNTALLVMLATGLRSGEVLALKWDVVDLDTGMIEVKRGVQRSQGGRVRTIVDEVKTDGSKRLIKLPADAVLALRDLRRERPFGLVFTKADGGQLHCDSLIWHCKKACRVLEVPEMSPHKLRHSNASMLLAEGHSVADVAMHLGHKDMRMVTTRYGHPMKAVIDTAATFDGVRETG